MTHAPWLPLTVVLSMLVGCGPRQQQGAAPEHRSRSSEQLEGRVYVTGHEVSSGVTLVVEDGGSMTLVGDLEPELRRLSGATVRVNGTQADRGPGRSFEVQDYEVLSIDGEQPSVGILTQTQGATSLAGRDTVELASVPKGLRGKEGAKVWVVGPRNGRKLEVLSFGIIREPGR